MHGSDIERAAVLFRRLDPVIAALMSTGLI